MRRSVLRWQRSFRGCCSARTRWSAWSTSSSWSQTTAGVGARFRCPQWRYRSVFIWAKGLQCLCWSRLKMKLKSSSHSVSQKLVPVMFLSRSCRSWSARWRRRSWAARPCRWRSLSKNVPFCTTLSARRKLTSWYSNKICQSWRSSSALEWLLVWPFRRGWFDSLIVFKYNCSINCLFCRSTAGTTCTSTATCIGVLLEHNKNDVNDEQDDTPNPWHQHWHEVPLLLPIKVLKRKFPFIKAKHQRTSGKEQENGLPYRIGAPAKILAKAEWCSGNDSKASQKVEIAYDLWYNFYYLEKENTNHGV